MAQKPRARKQITVAGAMSGTSLDGVDVAILTTDGVAVTGFGPTHYRPYSADERAILRAALGQWSDGPDLVAARAVILEAHVAAFRALEGFDQVDLVGFHGQTLAHDPAQGRSHQAGDGAALARALGRAVIWDFRSADIAMGGQGAPLAPFYHWALARMRADHGVVGFLNLGGVGNLTYVDASHDAPEADGALLAFDTGPANAPMDDLVARHRGLTHDAGGAMAAMGRVDEGFLERALAHPYFAKMPPKSLDRDTFAPLYAGLSLHALPDALATLAEFCARAVALGVTHFPQPPQEILVCGGGRRNDHLMARLRAHLGLPVRAVEDCGWDGDFLEAQAFAYLAARVHYGLPTSVKGTTGVAAAIGGGRRSEP